MLLRRTSGASPWPVTTRPGTSVARWPKFRQKAQKERGKKVGRKNLWPNVGQILPKVAEKGPKKIFKKSSLLYSNAKLSETKAKFNINF
jgi:hypothetical protein